jgi:hypothetical protein
MPREDEHLTKARKNEEFSSRLDLSDPTNESWAVISSFYAALHYVQAYFVKYGVECHDHKHTEYQFLRDRKIRTAYSSYKWLRDLSQTARYKCVPLPVPYSQAKPRLDTVRDTIRKAL